MKNLIVKSMLTLSVIVLAGASVFAGEIKREIKFNRDLTVNGTVVKKGTYTVVFDDQSGAVTFLKGKKEVARTIGSLTDIKQKARSDEFSHREVGNEAVLQSITFAGKSQTIVVNNSAQAAQPNQ